MDCKNSAKVFVQHFGTTKRLSVPEDLTGHPSSASAGPESA